MSKSISEYKLPSGLEIIICVIEIEDCTECCVCKKSMLVGCTIVSAKRKFMGGLAYYCRGCIDRCNSTMREWNSHNNWIEMYSALSKHCCDPLSSCNAFHITEQLAN
jgi:hypothetical protein